jgi:thiol-disulfide isomerase/thioredoxin
MHMAAMNINARQYEELTLSNVHVMVDFWAPWCTYCRRIDPALDKLADNGMFLIVETSDPNITAEKIHEAYDFPLEQLQIMPAKTNDEYRSMTEEQSSAPARVGFIGGAKTMIRTIIDCMKVKASISQGVVIQMASLIIGYGIIAVFSLVGDLGMLNFVHLILYQLFWTLLVLIIPNLKKL